jgi:hypothetical protein
MLSKLSLSALLAFSLSCFGQVVSTGGYATTAGPSSTPISAANAPLVATPSAALPGSGPTVGAPLGSSNTNDSRFSTGPSVYNPNSVGSQEVSAETANAASGTNSQPVESEPFEFGVQQVISSTAETNGPQLSLGEVARNLKANHHAPVRMINNDTIARLNAAQNGTANAAPQESNTVAAATQTHTIPARSPANCGTMIAQNQTPALPQGDQGDTAPSTRPCPK